MLTSATRDLLKTGVRALGQSVVGHILPYLAVFRVTRNPVTQIRAPRAVKVT
jgi:hypothetical protein